jgi:DNA polymerase III alpha subunit (gram-positive type)
MSRLPLNECNLFFFDSETGGLEASVADMVEVACVLTDPTGQQILAEYNAKVIPQRPVDPRAAAVNGYSAEKWAAEGAIDIDTAMVKLLTLARNSIFVSHNTPFDWSFFNAAMARRQARWPGDYHKIDTVALATPLLKFGRVPNLKLATLVAHFGLQQEQAHAALSDARDCRKVYLHLMARYAAAFST